MARKGGLPRQVCALCALACVLVVARDARAQPATGLELAVEDDAQACVTEPSLRARIDRFLRVRQPIDVEIVVRPDARPVAFELRRGGASIAERRFRVLPEACASRLDALAIAIAVAVEQAVGPEHAEVDAAAVAAVEEGREEPVATSTPEEPTKPEAKKPEAKKPEAKKLETKKPEAKKAQDGEDENESGEEAQPPEPSGPPLKVRLALLAGGDLLLRALPETAIAGHLGAELRLGSIFAASLAALIAPSVSIEVGDGRAQSVLLGLRAAGCAGSSPTGLRLEGCAVVAGGGVWAKGAGELDATQSTTVGWLGVGPRLAVTYPAQGPFGVRLSGDLLGNLVRPGVRVAGSGGTQRAAAKLGGAGSLELWLALP